MAKDSGKLAIDGGEPVKATPNPPMYPGGLDIAEDEKREILEALDRKYIFRYYRPDSHPSKVAQFEQQFAEKMGCRYALMTNSCTSALISSLMACEVGPGAEVIVPSYTYWSSVAAVLSSKAIPVIAEVDDSLTIDPDDLIAKITPQTKAVMPVHMRGVPCRMDRIMQIAEQRGLGVIEDNAQAMGGSFRGKRLGTFGHCGCFSLQYYKIITAGEGGIVATDDEKTYIRAQSIHDSAACWRPDRFAPGRWPWELSYGFDFRASELEGAVALAQLRRLDGLIEGMRARKAAVKQAIGRIDGLTYRRLNDPDGDTAICLIFYVPSAPLAEKFVKALQAEGVVASHPYHPDIPDWHVFAHWQHLFAKATPTSEGCPFTCPYYKGSLPEYSADMCPRSAELLARAVHIDLPPQLDEQDAELIGLAVRKVAGAYL